MNDGKPTLCQKTKLFLNLFDFRDLREVNTNGTGLHSVDASKSSPSDDPILHNALLLPLHDISHDFAIQEKKPKPNPTQDIKLSNETNLSFYSTSRAMELQKREIKESKTPDRPPYGNKESGLSSKHFSTHLHLSMNGDKSCSYNISPG